VEKGNQPVWGRVDNILYQNRIPHYWHLLGKVQLGKLLGLCTLHLLARAVVEYYKVDGWSAMLCSNIKRALELSSHHLHCIRPSAKCADICRSLKMTKPLLNGTFHYVHVYGHMDQYLKWEQLTLMQQLNCVCSMLAKKSITTAIIHGYHDRQSWLWLYGAPK
jgi:hypothetical protein